MATAKKPPKRVSAATTAGAGPVEDYLAKLKHPLKPELEALRAIVLAAHPGLSEGIKWNAPSYSVGGDDRVTFNLSAKDRVRLIFHCGVKAGARQGKGRPIEDAGGILEWAADDRAIATFRTMDEVTEKSAALKQIVKRWIAATCGA